MADLPLQEGETVLRQGQAWLIEGKLKVIQGVGYLTNKRLLRARASMLQIYFGLIGILLASIFNRQGKFDIDLPLASLKTLARDKYGRNTNVLRLTSSDDTEYRMTVDKFDEWIEAFKNALAQNQMQLVADGEEAWSVRRT